MGENSTKGVQKWRSRCLSAFGGSISIVFQLDALSSLFCVLKPQTTLANVDSADFFGPCGIVVRKVVDMSVSLSCLKYSKTAPSPCKPPTVRAPVRKFLCRKKNREPTLQHQRFIRVHPRFADHVRPQMDADGRRQNLRSGAPSPQGVVFEEVERFFKSFPLISLRLKKSLRHRTK